MALTPTDSQVIIDGETFDLIVIPSAESRMVQSAKKKLLGQLDLQSLVSDLGKLGKFMRVAYNGVAGNTEVQIKVQRVGYEITELADKSASTVQQFKDTSQEIIEDLKSTYQYLLDGLEKASLVTLSMMGDKAANMAEAAEELRKDFDQAKIAVKSTLEDTMRARGDQQKHKEFLEKQRKEFKEKKEIAEELERDTQEGEERAKKFYEEAQRREDKAQDTHDSIMRSIADSITGALTGVTAAVGLVAMTRFEQAAIKLMKIGDKSGYKEAIRMANEEKMKHLKQMEKERDHRREAIQQCIEFTQKIINCESDSDLAEAAVDALHHSVGALQSLSTTMMRASIFWKQMQKHCKALAHGEIKAKVEMMITEPPSKRLKMWTSEAFKEEALRYYSKWVALDDVSTVYMLQIEETSRELYKYLVENPTIEEARKNVRRLAADFADDLKKDQENERLKEIQASFE